MAKKKIGYAKNSVLDSDEFDPKHVKVTISIRLDGDVLKSVKADALKRGVKYQPLINQLLRDHYFGRADEQVIREIVRDEMKRTG
jgi:uncharacterized protein (DUF4415 family)